MTTANTRHDIRQELYNELITNFVTSASISELKRLRDEEEREFVIKTFLNDEQAKEHVKAYHDRIEAKKAEKLQVQETGHTVTKNPDDDYVVQHNLKSDCCSAPIRTYPDTEMLYCDECSMICSAYSLTKKTEAPLYEHHCGVCGAFFKDTTKDIEQCPSCVMINIDKLPEVDGVDTTPEDAKDAREHYLGEWAYVINNDNDELLKDSPQNTDANESERLGMLNIIKEQNRVICKALDVLANLRQQPEEVSSQSKKCSICDNGTDKSFICGFCDYDGLTHKSNPNTPSEGEEEQCSICKDVSLPRSTVCSKCRGDKPCKRCKQNFDPMDLDAEDCCNSCQGFDDNGNKMSPSESEEVEKCILCNNTFQDRDNINHIEHFGHCAECDENYAIRLDCYMNGTNTVWRKIIEKLGMDLVDKSLLESQVMTHLEQMQETIKEKRKKIADKNAALEAIKKHLK